MSNKELLFAASTLWVVIAAVLVMFMQAGFAFLEAGLTRMKNVGHVAAKNVLIFAVASIVYYLVGYGMAFGDGGNSVVGGSGFAPSAEELLGIGQAPFSWFSEIPAAAGYLFEVVFAGVSLAIVWGAMAERTKLWVYFAFGIVFTLIYSLVSHWVWSPDGWLFARGMQDFAGSTVVHYQGALAGLAGALLLGPRLGRFGADGRPNSIPGHNMAFTTLGVIILWFGWFGFNAGSTLSVQFGGLGFFAYVALNTNLAAAAGVIGAVATSWAVMRKPDLSMMLNGAIAALVAITAACAFVAPWGALVIGFGAGAIVVLGSQLVERARIDDPVGAIAAHGMAGVWGTLALGFFAMPSLAERLGTGQGGLLYTGSPTQLRTQALGLLAVGVFTFSASFAALWVMKATFGIRTDAEAEAAGLDVSEHGMWGYPELFTPVPGGYGTDGASALGGGWLPTPVPETG
jgi:Amt family ammonium transporter